MRLIILDVKEEDHLQVLNKVSEIGIDEVGRGAIFGPIFSAAIVLTEKNGFTLKKLGVKDSNTLTPNFLRVNPFFLVRTIAAENTGPKTEPRPTSSMPIS